MTTPSDSQRTNESERTETSLPAPEQLRGTNWPSKIAKAKEARVAAKKAREGKPATFSHYSRSR